MARATIETQTVTKTEEVEERVYTLTLSEEEAKSLRALTGWVAGSLVSTYCKHTSSIYGALSKAGVRVGGFSDRFELGDVFIKAKTITK